MISARLIALGIGYIFGIVCATVLQTNSIPFKMSFILFLALGAFITLWTLYREYNWKENHIALRIIPLLIASFCTGNLITNNFLYSKNPSAVFFKNLPDKTSVQLKGVIAAEPEVRSDTKLDLRLRISKFKRAEDENWTIAENAADIKISVSFPVNDEEKIKTVAKIADSDAYGYLIELEGIYHKSFTPMNPGGFDYETFLMAEGFIANIKVFDKNSLGNDYIKVIEEKKGNFFVEAALAAKKNFSSTIQKTILPPESFFVSGAVLGTRFSIKKQEYRGKLIEDFFRHSGVGHVLAVSGLHVSVVSLLLFSLFRLTRINPKYFTPFLILLLFLFAFLTGARPSSLRATIMNSLVIAFYVYGGGGLSQSAYTGLAFSSLLILLRRPMALYSAGFLLSFGAVLSLVTLTNPCDKILRSLRGGRLFAATLFFILVIYLICTNWVLFLHWETILLLIVLFFIFFYLGDLLNSFFPSFAIINTDKLPTPLRVFIAAQLGIQLGMMIPLSSFFFGQMPIAGIFVNFFAIPLIGVIVQLGLLGGIIGAIPLVGEPVALLLGAANYVFAKFFIWLAYIGSELLPFPVTPIPSLRWLAMYYLCVAIFASSVLWIRKFQNLLFVLYKKYPIIISKIIPAAALVSIAAVSFVLFKQKPIAGIAELHLLAGTSNPVICITRQDAKRGATLIGGGHPFFAKSSVKSFLLKKGTIFIEDIFVFGHSPESGTAAIAELGNNFRFDRIYYPNFHEPVESAILPLFDSMEQYFDTIGETKIHKSALDGKPWPKTYFESYAKFAKKHRDKTQLFKTPSLFKLDNGTEIEYLGEIYRSYSLPIAIKFDNRKILILPDLRSTKKIPKDKLKTDILIVAGPSKVNYKSYLKSLEYVFRDTSPKLMILCNDVSFAGKEMLDVIEKASDYAKKNVPEFIRTDQSGTISFKITDNILSEKPQKFLSSEAIAF